MRRSGKAALGLAMVGILTSGCTSNPSPQPVDTAPIREAQAADATAVAEPSVASTTSTTAAPKQSSGCEFLAEEQPVLESEIYFSRIANYDATQTLLNQLVDAVPTALAESATVSLLWGEQRDGSELRPTDDALVVAHSLLGALAADEDVSVLEAWAMETCGRPILAAVRAELPPPCPWAEESLPDVLDPGTSSRSLGAWFDTVDDGVPAARPAIADLKDAVDVLDPEARTSLEALLRTSFNHPTSDTLSSLNNAVADFCGIDGVIDVDRYEQHGPAMKDGAFANILDAFGAESCDERTMTYGLKVGYYCGESVQIVDLIDGSTSTVDIGSAGSGGRFFVRFAGDVATWTQSEIIPAEGLEPESVVETLHIVDVVTGDATDVELFKGDPDEAGDPVVVATFPDRFVVGSSGATTVVDDTGTVKFTVEGNVTEFGGNDPFADRVPPYIVGPDFAQVQVGFDRRLLHLDNGRTFDSEFSLENATIDDAQNICADRFLLRGNGNEYRFGFVNEGAVFATPTVELPALLKPTIVTRDVVVGDRDDQLTGFAPDGSVRWMLPADVVKRFDVVGGWILATNAADQVLLIDPYTGEESAFTGSLIGLTPSTLLDMSRRLFNDPTRDQILFDRDPTFPIELADLCPQAEGETVSIGQAEQLLSGVPLELPVGSGNESVGDIGFSPAGTWRGEVVPGPDGYSVVIEFLDEPRGEVVGLVFYPELECTAELRLIEQAALSARWEETTLTPTLCIGGELTLSANNATTLDRLWTGSGVRREGTVSLTE